ncbi:hypothetical protein V6N13_105777 [Hibiscus sabdariffa]
MEAGYTVLCAGVPRNQVYVKWCISCHGFVNWLNIVSSLLRLVKRKGSNKFLHRRKVPSPSGLIGNWVKVLGHLSCKCQANQSFPSPFVMEKQ